MKFAVVLADPPWAFKVWSKGSGNGRLPDAHYPTQDAAWIETLPVAAVAAKDCVLLMWATCPTLPEALRVIEAWGFSYKTVALSWVKTNRDGSPSMGMGYWTRANTELLLLATKGSPKRLSKSVRQVLLSRRRAHSQKPEEQYERIEQLLAGPYLEMFGRPGLFPRENWIVIGNQATGRDMVHDLRILAETEK